MATKNINITRRTFLKTLAYTAVGTGLITGGGYQYSARVEPEWLTVEQVTVPLPSLPTQLEGFKIVHMSDFHLYPFTQIELIREAVVRTNNLKPDLVALTGDYVLERADAIDELAPALAQINATYGVFAVLGNHDIWTDRTTVRTGLEQAGLAVLSNSGVLLAVGTETIYVAGLDDAWSGTPDKDRALEQQPPGVPTILLVHEPDVADALALDGRVSLQLSGHSHGGQVRLPGIGALILPYLGQKYDLGLYRVQDMWLYTNPGIGVIGPAVRFNCRPEITEITLVQDS